MTLNIQDVLAQADKDFDAALDSWVETDQDMDDAAAHICATAALPISFIARWDGTVFVAK